MHYIVCILLCLSFSNSTLWRSWLQMCGSCYFHCCIVVQFIIGLYYNLSILMLISLWVVYSSGILWIILLWNFCMVKKIHCHCRFFNTFYHKNMAYKYCFLFQRDSCKGHAKCSSLKICFSGKSSNSMTHWISVIVVMWFGFLLCNKPKSFK